MSKPTVARLLAVFSFFISISLRGVLYDNRFVRFIRVPYSREREMLNCERDFGPLIGSRFRGDVFILTSDDAYADADESIGIPEIFGKYDQRNVGQALECVGLENPIPDGLKAMSLPWKVNGKLQGQGVSFEWDQLIYKYFYVGCSAFFMRLSSRQDFILNTGVAPGDRLMLDAARRKMNDLLGIDAVKWTETNMSDLDCYFRVGNVWDYCVKMRRVDAGIRCGVLFPSGIGRQLNNPASVPFGANKHWGFYFQGDTELEFKEDLKFGCMFRISKRLAKTVQARIPIKDEQPLFAPVVGPLRIDPGLTFVFSPYLRIDGIREGLGCILNLTLVAHLRDSFKDKRPITEPPATLTQLKKSSKWIGEHITLNLFYDFSKVKTANWFGPKVQFIWDIPVQYFGAENVAKTNKVSLGLQLNY